MGEKLSNWFERTKTPVTVQFLADRYLVHPQTVREALRGLMGSGLVKRYRQGSKIFYRGV